MKNLTKIVSIGLVALGVGYAEMSSASAEETIELETRSGVTMEVLYQEADNPPAHLILFEGGPGKFRDFRYPPFLSETRSIFGENGFSVAAVNLPVKSQGRNMLPSIRYRRSPEFIQDMDTLIAWLRKKHDVPVWLVGVSLGTISVGELGAHSKENPSGVVFIASSKGMGRTSLDKINVPTLIVHHKEDGCGSGERKVDTLKQGLTNSPKVDIKWFSGGDVEGSNPCGPGTHHTFHGMQDEVANEISNFIKTNLK